MEQQEKLGWILFWLAVATLLFVSVTLLPDFNRNSSLGSLMIGLSAAVGAAVGMLFLRAIVRLAARKAKGGGAGLPRRREVLHVLFWVVLFVIGASARGWLPPHHSMHGVFDTIGLGVTVVSAAGFVIAVLMIGWNAKPALQGNRHVLRPTVGLKLLGFPMAAGFLWLAWLFAGSLIENGLPGGLGFFELTIALVLLVAVGVWMLVFLLSYRIEYDDNGVCAGMDKFLNPIHCHRWADLTGIAGTRWRYVLQFSDGGRVAVSVGVAGVNELYEHAKALLGQPAPDRELPGDA